MAVYDQEVVDVAPQYLQTKSYSAQKFRTWFADLCQPGVFSDADWALSLLGGLAYRIAVGKAYVPGLQVADQGMYRMVSLTNADLAVPTGHASLPRLDQVILRVMDNTHDGSGFNEGRIETVPGTATSGATLDNRSGAANLTTLGEASKNVLLLYDILMPAAASSISGGNVRRRAVLAKIGFGTLPKTIPYLTVAQFQALRDFPDGMEVYIIADASAGLIWHVRYNAAGGSYKWEIIGSPPPLNAEVTANESTIGSYADLTTVGPSIALPLSGDYDVEIGFRTVDNLVYMSYAIGGSGAVDADAVVGSVTFTSGTGVVQDSVYRPRRKTGLTAVSLVAKYKNVGTSAQAGTRWMRVTPIRVSQ